MHVLVTGGTGVVRSTPVPALPDAGHDVRSLVRGPERHDPSPGVEVATGDLLSPGSVDAAPDGAYCLGQPLHAGTDYDERDRRAARAFPAADTDGGAKR